MRLRVEIHPTDNRCPFENNDVRLELEEGECLWLQGDSGAGKSSIALHLVDLRPLQGANVRIDWEGVADHERSVGMVFQQGVLIDTLTVGENIGFALRTAGRSASRNAIDRALEEVGLSPAEAQKMPGQLSGGMLRRASLAQVLAQGKRVIVLDEPFVGLDEANANGIVRVIQQLMGRGQSFILISHEPQYAAPLATPGRNVALTARPMRETAVSTRWIPHWNFAMRTLSRLFDYLVVSAPLIFFAFIAAGIAISMLFSELLQATNIDSLRKQIVDTNPSWIEQWLGVGLFETFIGHEFNEIAGKHLPVIRQRIFAMGISRGFVIELGPLLTALLLAGRIGGSYAGEVSMMQATNQNQLLKTLGASPRRWTLLPATIAALISAPILTAIGVGTALFMAEWVALRGSYPLFETGEAFWRALASRSLHYESLWTFPPFVSFYHSIVFMGIIVGVAEFIGRLRPQIQPRGVPQSITWAVVGASLLIIIADWGLSQWLLYLHPIKNPLG